MKGLLVSLTALVVAACASPAPQTETSHEKLFSDALFSPRVQRVAPDQLFAMSDEMRAFSKSRIEPLIKRRGVHAGLYDALKTELTIDYDAAYTRTAAETFAARSGNCLSLVILTAAFAKDLGVPVSYQAVFANTTWSRANGIAFQSGHVNLVLGALRPVDISPQSAQALVIDFLPPNALTRYFTRPLNEETIIAMYQNNRAGEALADDVVDAAYWFARDAIDASPTFSSPLNTLGVVYLRHDNPVLAERALRAALEREPENVNVLTNLVNALVKQNRVAEAQVLKRKIAEIAPYPPFHFFDEGMTAMENGDYGAARDLFNKELDRMPYDDEVLFALAVAEIHLGELSKARVNLNLALEQSTTPDRRNIYAAKLHYLKSLHN